MMFMGFEPQLLAFQVLKMTQLESQSRKFLNNSILEAEPRDRYGHGSAVIII